MNKFVSIFGMLLILSAFGCVRTNRIDISLASPNEALPYPKFVTKEESQIGQRAHFSEIAVYRDADGCQIPQCPLMWRVIVIEEHSPIRFNYAGITGFGSATKFSPRTLEPMNKYYLVVGPANKMHHSEQGQLSFQVTEDGRVIAAD